MIPGVVSSFRRGSTPPSGFLDTFDVNTIANYTQFASGMGTWTIGGGSCVCTSGNQTILSPNGLTIADGWVECDSSRMDDGGLVMRMQNNDNYYLLALRDGSSANVGERQLVSIFNKSGGNYNQLTSVIVAWSRGELATWRFSAVGNVLTAYKNGTPVLTTTNNSFFSGRVGMRANDGSASWRSEFERLAANSQ